MELPKKVMLSSRRLAGIAVDKFRSLRDVCVKRFEDTARRRTFDAHAQRDAGYNHVQRNITCGACADIA
jgi:hypothetical protein